MFKIFLVGMIIVGAAIMIGVHLVMGGTMAEVEAYLMGKINFVYEQIINLF